jgi:molecular chaperone DnaK
MVFQTEKALADVGDQLSDADKSTVQADIDHLKDLLNKTNPEVMSDGEVDDLKAAKEKLMNDSQALFQKVYEKAQAQSGPQGGPGPDMGGFNPNQGGFDPNQGGFNPNQGGYNGGNNGDGGDYVDADFKEV